MQKRKLSDKKILEFTIPISYREPCIGVDNWNFNFLTQREDNGVLYGTTLRRINKKFEQMELGETFLATLTEDGKLKLEVVPNNNSIPLPSVRELIGAIYIEGRDPYGLRFAKPELLEASGPILDSDCILEPDALRIADSFQFVYPDRTSFQDQDFISNSTSTCKTITYLNAKTFKYLEGNTPSPRVGALITYVPDGEFYIVFGGIVPLKRSYSIFFNKAVEILDETEMFAETPREEIREHLEQRFFATNEMWRYNIIQGSWTLLSPGIAELRMVTKIHLFGFFHAKRQKIYYIPSAYLFSRHLYEYDYYSNEFRSIDWYSFDTPLDNQRDNRVIDYSNDTLLIPSYDCIGIVVFCFETHESIRINLEDTTYSVSSSLFSKSPFFKSLLSKKVKKMEEKKRRLLLFLPFPWRIRLMDDFNKLVIFPSYDCQFVTIVNWGFIKRNILNPQLEVKRKIYRESKPTKTCH